MKDCRSCGETKTFDKFYPNRAKCKKCYCDQTNAHYQVAKAKYRKSRREYMRVFREDPINLLKSQARVKLGRAVRKGEIIKKACWCGASKVEGHHYNGYDGENILKVIWLCKLHHTEIHLNA